VRELVANLPPEGIAASLTVGDLLARTPHEAEELLGGAPNLQNLRNAFIEERRDALEAATGLADGPPLDVVDSLETGLTAGERPADVLQRLKAEEEARPQPDAQRLELIRHTATLLRVSGNRIEALMPSRRQPGG
jgi:hypothetical protein